ncbi:MAG: class I tRNA ligase family protein, partial [Rhodobacteraceae bacterium]|nr:class I tRNA ligase family protein [Paracoccaceae bacterium]
RSFDGHVPAPVPESGEDAAARGRIGALACEVGALVDEVHLDRALKGILAFSAHFNQYFQHCEPWKGGEGAATCVHLSANAVRSLAIALCAFVPSSAQRMWEQLGEAGSVEAQPWEAASEVRIGAGHAIGRPSALFARVDEGEIAGLKESLGGASG